MSTHSPICSSIPQVAVLVISQSSTWSTRAAKAPRFVRDGDGGSCTWGRSDGVGSHLWMMWRSAGIVTGFLRKSCIPASWSFSGVTSALEHAIIAVSCGLLAPGAASFER